MVDLIYADKNGIDIDILHEYSFDLAYGSDENDFELTVPLRNNDMQEGYTIYIDGTEYGGIIDSIKADTKNRQIIYGGRTWHGIMCRKIIDPDSGFDYLVLNGDANAVIAELIIRCNLSNVFYAPEEESGIQIINYSVRYNDMYTVLTSMLFEAYGKLKIKHQGTRTELSAVPYVDYSIDEEWDSSQRSFSAGRNYRPVNHLICLGGGNLKDRYVIHLFTDENGGIQPYSSVENPLRDSQYILTKDNQKFFDSKEISEVYDFPNADFTDNYIRMAAKPSDFDKNFGKYYQLVNGKYEELKSITADEYVSLTSQPSNWASNYADYYVASGSNYKRVEGVSTTVKEKIPKSEPSDWKNNYGNYYYYFDDGASVQEYRQVQGLSKDKYKRQTTQPTDWKTNYNSYYTKNDKGDWINVPGKPDGKDKNGNDKYKAPKWNGKDLPKKVYTKYTRTVAPAFNKTIYYYIDKTTVSAPTFAAGTYYTIHTITHYPSWIPNMYYELSVDHYAELVAGGIKKLREYADCDSISIELNPDIDYDIGDVVGAIENVTGLSVWQPITKKIVTINEKKTTISYEVGKE